MKINKSIVSSILLLFMVFSTVGSVVATDPLTLTVTFDKKTAAVGDTVQLTIVQKNNGIYDSFKNIQLLIKVEGNGTSLNKTAYLLTPPGDAGNNTFDSATGIWQSKNLKKNSSSGGAKTLVIYIKVPASLEGKTITANAHYNSIQPDPAIVNLTFSKPGDVSDSLTVQKNSTGTGNSTGSITNTGTNTKSTSTNKTDKKTAIIDALKNATSGNGLNNLQNLNQAQGGAYEINNSTVPDSSGNSRTGYIIVGGLIIAALIALGYFKGIKG